MRSAVDGNIISEGLLVLHVLENTLLKTVDWNQTLRSSIGQLSESRKTAVLDGFGSHIPPSLVQDSSLEVVILSKLGVSNVNGPPDGSHPRPEYPPHSIAIVGMAGRFPGADSVDELWDLIIEGKTTVEPAPMSFPAPSTTRIWPRQTSSARPDSASLSTPPLTAIAEARAWQWWFSNACRMRSKTATTSSA